MPDALFEFNKLPRGTVHKTIGLLYRALSQLNASVDNATIEHIGVMVHRAMSTQQRTFHTPEHIFDLADPTDPHTTLAALFHDVVYYQVDEGFLPEIEQILEPFIMVSQDAVSIRQEIPADARAFYGCSGVFGFAPGQQLSPFGGLNEFLSALVMDSLLESLVPDVDLLIATACIEETIPFRGPDRQGRRPPELLEQRITVVNQSFGLGLSDEDIQKTVSTAVIFSNRDVYNFSESDPGRFLDNTWKLLPESNPSLRVRGLYTIRNYSIALMKMEAFLSRLAAENVFNQYGGHPPAAEYTSQIKRAKFNLQTAEMYLGVKMISAGILLALADMTGGDAPIAYFMGDIDPQNEQSELTTFLPDTPACCGRADDEGDVLFRLLKYGRADESHFDLKHSPLSLFIYRSLDDQTIQHTVEAARHFFADDSDPPDFLANLPPHLVGAIAHTTSHMAFTRTGALQKIAREYSDAPL